jgi:NAD(P)H-dependent FMN reductase
MTNDNHVRGTMIRIAVVVGSTRPGRRAESVARWVHEQAQSRSDARFDLVDIADFGLPLLDEPVPPLAQQYSQPHTIAWSEAVSAFDGFVFVTPEYNHAPPAALKNALDFLYAEWNDKAAAMVTYGVDGGLRAGEQLRLVLSELKIATVRSQVALSFDTDFADWTVLAPAAGRAEQLATTLDELVAWAGALAPLRGALVA